MHDISRTGGVPRTEGTPEQPVEAPVRFPRYFELSWPYAERFFTPGESLKFRGTYCYYPHDIAQVERRRLLFAPIATRSLASVTHVPQSGRGCIHGGPTQNVAGGVRALPLFTRRGDGRS